MTAAAAVPLGAWYRGYEVVNVIPMLTITVLETTNGPYIIEPPDREIDVLPPTAAGNLQRVVAG